MADDQTVAAVWSSLRHFFYYRYGSLVPLILISIVIRKVYVDGVLVRGIQPLLLLGECLGQLRLCVAAQWRTQRRRHVLVELPQLGLLHDSVVKLLTFFISAVDSAAQLDASLMLELKVLSLLILARRLLGFAAYDLVLVANPGLVGLGSSLRSFLQANLLLVFEVGGGWCHKVLSSLCTDEVTLSKVAVVQLQQGTRVFFVVLVGVVLRGMQVVLESFLQLAERIGSEARSVEANNLALSLVELLLLSLVCLELVEDLIKLGGIF